MFLCVIPLITFTENLRLILNINEKKGVPWNWATCAFLYFVSSLFFCALREFCTPLAFAALLLHACASHCGFYAS
jgi:hypothetical protein